MRNGLWRKELVIIIIGLFIAMSFNLPVSGNLDDKYNKNTNQYIDNHPPEIPSFTSYTTGASDGITCDFQFTTTDPDYDDIYYFIEWGDGNNSGWLGPYKSGDIGETTYIWNYIGTYYYRIKAKDSYGAESNWSSDDNYRIEIRAYIEIRMHRGFGVGVTVTIKNLGIKDYENIPWTFELKRAYPKYPQPIKLKDGVLKSLNVGEEVTLRSGFIFNFALRAEIIFFMGEPIVLSDWHYKCKIIGPFVYIPIIPRNP